ncbi:MAG: hypothetical protein C0404_06830 [Verrucomicrobia bacterium]|nr:hypothetical protein [Verrucomicrobiota bacterium]
MAFQGERKNRQYTFGNDGRYEISIANTLAQRKRAWRMVYQSYLEKGYAAANSEELWYGLFDAMPQTTTLLVSRNGEDIATATVVFDSELGLPADELYANELNECRMMGRRLCEVVSLVSNETDHRACVEVLKHLFKLALFIASKLVDATDFVITVNPHHASYYEKKLLFRRRGDEKSYSKVGGAPAVLLLLDLVTLADRYMDACGTACDSVWHHFFEEEAAHSTVRFLAENIDTRGRSELMRWFGEKNPAVLERLARYVSPFDAVRLAQEQHSMTGLADEPGNNAGSETNGGCAGMQVACNMLPA